MSTVYDLAKRKLAARLAKIATAKEVEKSVGTRQVSAHVFASTPAKRNDDGQKGYIFPRPLKPSKLRDLKLKAALASPDEIFRPSQDDAAFARETNAYMLACDILSPMAANIFIKNNPTHPTVVEYLHVEQAAKPIVAASGGGVGVSVQPLVDTAPDALDAATYARKPARFVHEFDINTFKPAKPMDVDEHGNLVAPSTSR